MRIKTNHTMLKRALGAVSVGLLALTAVSANAAVKLEKSYKVASNGLYFNGTQTKGKSPNANNPAVMDYAFGPRISAHGDAIKVYKDFIFTTWYKGGKSNRNLMLSRYNTKTGVVKTVEFPHKHTGFRGDTLVGESHNTAAVGISPKDGKIHILYDMHSYNNAQFPNDYFRYSYSKKNAATVADKDFKLSLFVADGKNDYGHNSLNGQNNPGQYSDLTYPTFFLNENNDLLFYMRTGGNNNGGYVFTKYNASTAKWANMTQFNYVNSKTKSKDVDYNWGLYGEMKYVDGKLRTAFQKRSANNNDKFEYQNGIYYAYSDDQSGKTSWKTHSGKSLSIPLANPEPMKIFEPGNLVKATGKNQVYIVGGFDFTVTDRGDVHIISQVKDKKNNVIKNLHSYKAAGKANFTHSTDFKGAEALYTSGKNVYNIGLSNGRPFVQKTVGGTNNFKTIFEMKTGKSYSHGVPHIFDGKVYYYLQEKGDSTSLPLHVLIIDLDIDDANSEPTTPSKPVVKGPNEHYEFAANGGEMVDVKGTMNVAFGANGKFFFHYNQTQDILCDRKVFGDPAPGVVKKCFIRKVATTQPEVEAPATSNCQKYWLSDDQKEINLSNGTCVDLPKDLQGKTLQVWDSDRASCDFRGKVKTIGGNGTLIVDSNYVSAINLTGKTILFDASNSCKAVKMRLF